MCLPVAKQASINIRRRRLMEESRGINIGAMGFILAGEGLPYFYPMTLGNKLLRPGGTIRGIIWESPPSIKHSIELYFFSDREGGGGSNCQV